MSMRTCGGSDRGFGGVHVVPMDGLGAASSLPGPAGGPRFDDDVHVLHQLQLLPPEVFLLDELPPGLVFLLPDALLLCFQSGRTERVKESEFHVQCANGKKEQSK